MSHLTENQHCHSSDNLPDCTALTLDRTIRSRDNTYRAETHRNG